MQPSKLRLTFLAAGLLIAGIGCKKDDVSVKTTAVQLTIVNPANLQNVATSNLVVTFREVNTNITTANNLSGAAPYSFTLPQGAYEITLEGDIKYTDGGTEYTSKVRGYQKDIAVTGNTISLSLPLFLYNAAAKFVFKEIFFTGNQTPENKIYNGDKYFIIYNNSADTLYADRLLIADAEFLTTTKREYTPNIMNETFTALSVVMIPGDGDDYQVLPGQQLLIANNAINHKEINANSLNLTKANFELQLLPTINVDNPAVPDLINVTGPMTMHNRGFRSMVIARMPAGMTVEAYNQQNTYDYTYYAANGNLMTQTAFKIPNTWIMDAVNLSVEASFEWITTAASLDMGWTYCGKLSSDPNRFGKAVRRKELSTTPDGRVILMDHNNSTKDFEPEVKPSLMH